METYQASCIYDGKATLAEGPGWDDELQAIVWVDIEKGQVCRFYPGECRNETWAIGQRVGCVVRTSGGKLLAGGQQGLLRLDPGTGQVTALQNPEPDLPQNRFNDGKCDPQGRLWAGTMSCSEEEGAGSLYRITSDGAVKRMVESVTISNGLAWSCDQRTMYYIDTPTRHVDAYDFDRNSGAINNHRPLIEIPKDMGYPDGMTIDADGKLWVALWAGWGVGCWDPETGSLLAKVEVPVECVTACCFGGKDFRTLYITTASRDLDAQGHREQPLAGGLFSADVGVAGLPTPVFQEA
ncbi:MAG: SMP-30/gluconolactonase/LRE family protein [Verrucomicrobiota bacterium]|nr:SMP-30/gluconolactonase/LRE family protein [Verrucomicrobiota bacterium]